VPPLAPRALVFFFFFFFSVGPSSSCSGARSSRSFVRPAARLVFFFARGQTQEVQLLAVEDVAPSKVPGALGVYTGSNPLDSHIDVGRTSSASAIVAGCAVSLQGISLARGQQLTPTAIRKLLSAPLNTPSGNPAVDLIGVMPNLAQLVAAV
jgi:hypothetical protein